MITFKEYIAMMDELENESSSSLKAEPQAVTHHGENPIRDMILDRLADSDLDKEGVRIFV